MQTEPEIKHVAQQLGVRLRQWRLQKGWSQRHMADLVGLHRPNISRIEKGETHVPTLSILLRFSRVHSRTLAELFEGID